MTNEPNETGTRSDAPESEEKKVRKWDFVNKQWAATIIFSGVVLLLVAFLFIKHEIFTGLLSYVFDVLRPITIGLVIAFILYRPTCQIDKLFQRVRKKFPRFPTGAMAVFCSYFLMLALLCVIIWIIVPQFITSIRDFGDNIMLYYNNVMKFLKLVNHPDGMNIGMRHISLSPCGLVDKIEQLAERDLQLTLSVSLHSPDDESRSKIMPVNRRWPVDTLLAACRDYFAKTGRRISFEYTMIDGVSDSPEQAELLSKKLAGMGAHVNMIPLNNVTESGLHTSSRQAIHQFQSILEANGITATLRRTLGSDIDASCGQLRRKYEKT